MLSGLLMSKLLVSCVCPTYRRPQLVQLTIRLFLAQTWERSELIIIDDSPAGEGPSAPSHPRVRLVRLNDRLTMGEKHNVGHALAQGDVLCYWDDDDYWGPRRLVCQLEPIAMGEAEMTGLPRDLVAKIPSGGFFKFAPDWFKSRANRGNTVGNFNLPWHDGTAMYSRRALSLGVQHPALNLNQKVQFINGIVARGVKWKRVHNHEHFVYVRHDAGSRQAPNTWQFREQVSLTPAPTPLWFPREVLAFWKGIA